MYVNFSKGVVYGMKRWMIGFAFVCLCFGMSACGSVDQPEENEDMESQETASPQAAEEGQMIEVELMNTAGEKTGTARLEQMETGVNITISAWDLPKGTHGFHIHETGKCELPDFTSAGGHFNPTDAKHGFDHPKGPHAGDLPNLEVGEDGKVTESFLAEMVTLEKGKPNTLLRTNKTALIIHADADDNISQPAGDAGERIACGVISK